MDELVKTVFGACVSVLIIELLSDLFPEKTEAFVRGCAVLTVCAAVLLSLFRLDISEFHLTAADIPVEISESDIEQSTAAYGVELLKKRLYTILDAAGIAVSGNEDGIAVRYRLDDAGTIDIACVEVCAKYSSDIDRAHSVLRGVLTEMIPVEVYTQ